MILLLDLSNGVKGVVPTAAIETIPPEKIGMLIFAVNTYANSRYNLNGPLNDAALVGSTFHSVYNIPIANITYILDAEATKANILLQASKAVVDYEYVIVYWSGHGSQAESDNPLEPDRKEEVLVAYDHSWADPLYDDMLYEILCKAKYSWLIADCCHAQGMSRGGLLVRSIIAPQKRTLPPMKAKRVYTNICEIAACKSDQLSFERLFGGKWYGAFSYYFCQELLKKNTKLTYAQLQNVLREHILGQDPCVDPLSDASLFLQVA